MAWMTGELTLLAGSDRFHLERQAFHCGDPLEIRIDGSWYRGRVERSDRLGWYWTNNRTSRRLLAGDEARIWDGRVWPAPDQDRPGRER